MRTSASRASAPTVDGRVEGEVEPHVVARCHLFDGFGQHLVERLVERPRERGDRAAGVAEGALGRSLDLARRLVAGRREPRRAAADVEQLLRDAVVQVARDPPPLLEHGRLRKARASTRRSRAPRRTSSTA